MARQFSGGGSRCVTESDWALAAVILDGAEGASRNLPSKHPAWENTHRRLGRQRGFCHDGRAYVMKLHLERLLAHCTTKLLHHSNPTHHVPERCPASFPWPWSTHSNDVHNACAISSTVGRRRETACTTRASVPQPETRLNTGPATKFVRNVSTCGVTLFPLHRLFTFTIQSG